MLVAVALEARQLLSNVGDKSRERGAGAGVGRGIETVGLEIVSVSCRCGRVL